MFEAFEIGPVIIWTRLLMLLLGIWLSTEFFLRLSQSAGLSIQSIREDALKHLIAFLLGGRLFAMIAGYQSYLKYPLRILIVWDGGFSFLGAAIGVAAVLFWSTRNQRATFLQWLDVLFPATTFGLAFDWFGLFLSAQSYGKPTNLPWGITLNTYDVIYTVPIHPVQLYYAAFYLLLTFVLLIIRQHSRRAGAETLIGIIAASVAVFFFEYFRGDTGIPAYAKITDFAFLGCLFVSLGLLALFEQRFTERVNTIYGGTVAAATLAYVIGRPWIDLPMLQLRFSQVLAVLALLATVIYVVVHRRKYPHL